MVQKPWKSRLWNVIILITILLCGLVFAMHYKNWIRQELDRLTILSGFYFKEVPYSDLDEVGMVRRIPELERINGFSAWEKEKGIFRDSLRPDRRIYIYVDNLFDQKIRLVYQDSIELYLNLSDSLATKVLYDHLNEKLAENKGQ